jgi:hypothetical protein
MTEKTLNKNLPSTAGEVALLNVGEGDTKLSFDPKNPAERIRAARIVADMLKRGYALLIQLPDGSFTRCLEFREDACEYIIADFDPVTASEHDAQEEQHDGEQQGQASEGPATPDAATPAPRKRGRPRKVTSVPAAGARAVAVAPTAGG